MTDRSTSVGEVPEHESAVGEDIDQLRFSRRALEIFFLCAFAFLIATGVRTFLVQPFFIPTESMEPTLRSGDRVLVSKVAYRLAEPMPGDIVVLDSPEDPDIALIKRIVAVAGQTLEIRDGVVSVDGVALSEPYVPSGQRDDLTFPEPLRIPAGHVFVMGDNRIDSADSRVFGPQPVEAISGRALAIYWPPADARKL
jgi:signal peptidase I